MIYIALNLIPILAATLAGLAFGAIYASITRQAAARLKLIITAFIAEFWLAAILAGALILAPSQGGVWTMTLGSAFVIWIGFVVPVLLTSYRFRNIPVRTTLTDSVHWLGVMLVQATVLRLIGLTAPPV